MRHEDTFLLIPRFRQLIWGTRQGRDARGDLELQLHSTISQSQHAGAALEWGLRHLGSTIMLEKDAPVG